MSSSPPDHDSLTGPRTDGTGSPHAEDHAEDPVEDHAEDHLDISAIIRPELVSWNIQATSREQAVAALCATLSEASRVTDPDAFYRDVLRREEEGATSLGNGVAIPHGKSSAVVTTSVALGRCAEPVPWGSEDDSPVRLIFLFAVRLHDAADKHLRLLQLLATCLADDSFTRALPRCATALDAYTLLTHHMTTGAHR